MRANLYFTEETKKKADALAKKLGLPLSRLFSFLVIDYIRKNKIKLEEKDELK